MEDKRNEMMVISMYADNTGLFTEEECNYDNTTELEVPRWIVEEWYKTHKKECKQETSEWTRIPEEEITFSLWLNEGHTFDSFIGFYNFCIIKGIVPNIATNDIDDKVFYLDDDDNKHVIFEGTYNECRRFGRMWDWSYLGYDLQLEIE